MVCLIATDIYSIILGRILQGLGAVSSVLMALTADIVRNERRATANAVIGLQIGITFLGAILLAPVIASAFGMQGLFLLIAVLALLSIGVALTLPTVKRQRYCKVDLAAFKNIIRLPFIRLNVSVFLLHSVMTSLFICLPTYWVEYNIAAVQDHWQIYLPVMMLSFLLMVPFIFYIERRKQTGWPLNTAVLFVFITCFAFYYQPSGYLLSFVLLSIFFTGFNTLEAAIPALITKISKPNQYGLTMGVHSSFQFSGAFFGGMLGGLLLENFGRNSVFLMNAFIALAWFIFISVSNQGVYKNGRYQ